MGKSKFVLFAMALIFMSCQENARHISRDRFVKDNENFNVESWNNFHVSVRSAGFLFSYEVDPYLFNDRVGYCKSFVVIPQEERWYVRGRNNLMEDVDSLIYSIKWKEEYPELDASEFKNKFDWIVKNDILYLDCSNNICYVKSCNFNLMAEKDSISSLGHCTIWRDWPQGCYHEPPTKYDEEYLKGLHEKDKRYMISDLTINYSQSIRPYCLGDHMTVEEFLALSDLRKKQVNDSAIIALFQEIITTSEKDTVRFVRDTVIIDDICFDPVTWQTVEPEEGEEQKGIVDVYGYWENGPSACYVVELHTGCGTDTLIIPNSPSIVQYNNTVFKDSTLFYTVTALISKNDAEWAKGHFRESQNRDDCPVYRFKYENTPTGDITFLQQ